MAKDRDNFYVDALHLSIPAQGLANGEAALQHAAAYPGMQPYPGVGEWSFLFPSCVLSLTLYKYLYSYLLPLYENIQHV